jgi:hypothetical protein
MTAAYRAAVGAALFKVCRDCGRQTDEWDSTPGVFWPEQDQCFPCHETAWSEALRAMARRVAAARHAVDSELREIVEVQGEALAEYHAERERARHARHWLRGRLAQRLSLWFYSMGITSSGGTSYGGPGGCNGCVTMRFSGRRVYILGVSREAWFCLLRGRHRRREIPGAGLCSVCAPCPTCLSADPTHDAWACEIAAERVAVETTGAAS